ncbi:MAG: hypothetical protein M0Z71_05180 [Nitrospiraceae bacterium]|nr:hypothetical protein [Nitrospiraceae bacterium]
MVKKTGSNKTSKKMKELTLEELEQIIGEFDALTLDAKIAELDKELEKSITKGIEELSQFFDDGKPE